MTRASVHTPLGSIDVEVCEGMVRRIELRPGNDGASASSDATLPPGVHSAIRDVLEGRPIQDRPPLEASGTPFQRAVWDAIARIPFGETRTYGAIARELGRPRASRAVGSACGANPIPLLVPCHRVVASDGGLGGFSGGLDIKRALLRAEGHATV